jgi:hypothetical protein
MGQLKEVARLVNAAGDEDGVAVFAPDQGEKTFSPSSPKTVSPSSFA